MSKIGINKGKESIENDNDNDRKRSIAINRNAMSQRDTNRSV